MIHAFNYSLKPYLKGFIKAQAQTITYASLNEVIVLALKLD